MVFRDTFLSLYSFLVQNTKVDGFEEKLGLSTVFIMNWSSLSAFGSNKVSFI